MHIDIESLRTLDRATVGLTLRALEGATTGDLSRHTPCDGWDLEALVRHMVGQHRGFAAAARGGRPSRADFEPVRDADPIAAYPPSTGEVLAAFARLGEGEQVWVPELTGGPEFPASFIVGAHALDNVVHAWDVARTLGRPLDIPDQIAAGSLHLARAVETPRGAGQAFGEPVRVPAGASALDQLIAWSGRDPGW